MFPVSFFIIPSLFELESLSLPAKSIKQILLEFKYTVSKLEQGL